MKKMLTPSEIELMQKLIAEEILVLSYVQRQAEQDNVIDLLSEVENELKDLSALQSKLAVMLNESRSVEG